MRELPADSVEVFGEHVTLSEIVPLYETQEERTPPPPWDNCESAVIPDLVNVYFPTGDAFRWYALEREGDGLCIEEVYVDEIGTVSQRLGYEIEQADWTDMMDLPWTTDEKIQWAVEEGIAPGQPFLIRFGEPDHYQTGGWDGPVEYDVNYDTELVRVIPWPAERAASVWEEFFAARKRMLDYRAECQARFDGQIGHHPEVMNLRRTRYYGASCYDEMCPPNGVRYTLYSEYEIEATLFDHLRGLVPYYMKGKAICSGESDQGDEKAAKEALVKKVLGMYPHMTREQVLGFPVKDHL